MNHDVMVLQTAGARIRCLRCTAQSKRTGSQCGRPALKSSKTQKCQFHGGRSSGPKTEAGKVAISKAKLKHGRETLQKRVNRSLKLLWLSQIQDALIILGMTAGTRKRGRRPIGYIPLSSVEDVADFFVAQQAPSKTQA